jgi:two-component system, cell cycle response regulator
MQHERDPYRMLDLVYQKLDLMTDQVEKNMQIFRRSQERELELLRATDLQTLLSTFTGYLRESYGLQCVTVMIADPEHEVRHLLRAANGQPELLPDVHFVESLTGITPRYTALRQPWTGPFVAADHQLLFPGATGIGSIAVIPLIHQGALFGSINFASPDKDRFTRQHATDFLAHLGVIATFALENVVNRARLLRSGFTDVLTGWHNRRYLQMRLTEELARAARDSTCLVELMIDIDHFKRVNDTWGHAAGDRVLAELAQRIESQVRASDIAARYGGEEFVVLMPATTTLAGRRLAERIRAAVAATPIDVGRNESVTITTSIGIASISPDRGARDLKTLGDSLLARADVALYRAKSEGRDRIVVDDSEGDQP